MKKTGWRMNGAAAAASLGLIAAALFACNSDDSSTTPPTADGGGDTSTATDAAHDAPVATDATADAPSTDTSVPDTSVSDAARDAAVDATADAAPAVVSLQSLNVCAWLDADSQADIEAVESPAAPPVPPSYDDHVLTWGTNIMLDPSNFQGYVFNLFQNDCRTAAIYDVMKTADGSVDATAFAAFQDQVIAFNVQFMGCGVADAGAVTFTNLLPAGTAGHTFTQADLAAISDVYLNSVIQEATYAWFNTFTIDGVVAEPEPLNSDQIDAIKANLAALAAAMPGVNASTTKLTYSTCPTDDGGADAGHD